MSDEIVSGRPDTTSIAWSELAGLIDQQYGEQLFFVETMDNGARLTSNLQRLQGEVTAGGLKVASTDPVGGEPFNLKLTGLGRSGSGLMVPSPEARISVQGNTVRVERAELTEEYMVSADGIRQDFLLASPPPGKGEVRLEISLTGAGFAASGEGARLILEGSDRNLIYSRLLALDARGRKLPARMVVESSEMLALLVDDTDAKYPLRIDPTISDEDWTGLISGTTGMDNQIFDVTVDKDGILYAGGSFTTAGGAEISNIAKWDGTSWSGLGVGLNDAVEAIVTDSSGNLYAGGWFTHAGETQVNHIAKWDGTSWSALNGGFSSWVNCLALDGDDNLYAGGSFLNALESPWMLRVNFIAKWDGSTWSALDSGRSSWVYSIAVDNDDNVYVGGDFRTVHGGEEDYIAKWDGTSWSALGNEIKNSIHALATDSDGNVYAAGLPASFQWSYHVGKWDGTSWTPLGSEFNGRVNDIVVDSSGNLYIGGDLWNHSMEIYHAARWDGVSWNNLGSVVGWTNALALDSAGNLYAGGNFTHAGGVEVNRLAKWNGRFWSGVGPVGMNGVIRAVAEDDGGNLYAGGVFTTADGLEVNGVAWWDGKAWSALGAGMNAQIWALAADADYLYAAGDFTMADGTAVNHIARWNGTSWGPLGSGMNGKVYALAVGEDGSLYAAGNFTTAGGAAANSIARWNGTSWSPLGAGVNGTVSALAVDAGSVYAGGLISVTAAEPSHRVAKWNGSSWSALGTGMNSNIQGLVVDKLGNLYAGGWFTTVGGTSVNHVTRWDGTSWRPVGSGLNRRVYTLAVDGGSNLYAGTHSHGAFSLAGPNDFLAKWDGSSWKGMNSGMNGVSALATGGLNRFYAGGWLSTTDSGNLFYLARCELPTGTLTVNIEPIGAHVEGARWSIDGGSTWHEGGEELTLVSADYTVIFNDLEHWEKPADINITIHRDSAINKEAAYVRNVIPVTSDGVYHLEGTFSGRITIGKSASLVHIIGSNPDKSNLDTYIIVEGDREGPLTLTIENLNITAPTPDDADLSMPFNSPPSHGIDFAGGAGNFDHKLYLLGINTLSAGYNGAGLHLPEGVRLVIDKTGDTGELTAIGHLNGAGIGGGYRGNCGHITINGGIITAIGGDNGAGMGGGESRGGGNITIKGGKVTATGGHYAAGIGGGNLGLGGSLTVEGGEVTASAGYGSAGIGGGYMRDGGTTTIQNGTVTATGAAGGAGIGGGHNGRSGTIMINGGTVNATGGTNGSGIGSGNNERAGNITIKGGKITATGGHSGAGIGGGNKGLGGSVTIEGGEISATAGYGSSGIGGGRDASGDLTIIRNATVTVRGDGVGGAGIGGGSGGVSGTIHITNSRITAQGGNNGAGIGGGHNGSASWITITDSVIEAFSGGAGIGGGNNGSSTRIEIKGSTVTATGGMGGAGIGGGDGQSSSNIIIEGSTVTALAGTSGAGLGGGRGGNGGSITIRDSEVSAVSYTNGAGIGGGSNGSGGTVNISGQSTYVSTSGGSYDIGSGQGNSTGGSLTVNGGATLYLNRNGTNAQVNFITCTIGGQGAGHHAGRYLNGRKQATLWSAPPTFSAPNLSPPQAPPVTDPNGQDDRNDGDEPKQDTSKLLNQLQNYLVGTFSGIGSFSEHSGYINQGEQTDPVNYASPDGSDLVFALNWGGSELKLSVFDPDGKLYKESSGSTPPLTVVVQNAAPGDWSYTVTAIDVPYDNYEYSVMVGQIPQSAAKPNHIKWIIPLGLLLIIGLFVLLGRNRIKKSSAGKNG